MRGLPIFVVLWALVAAVAMAATEPGAVASSTAVTTVGAIRGLPDAVIRSRPRVSVQGVVSFLDPVSGLTYLEDNEGGIELRGLARKDGLVPGRSIVVNGHVDDSKPIPGVIVAENGIKLLEQGPVPPGRPLAADQIRTGEHDGRRVTLEASVFNMALTTERGDPPWLRLNVATPSGHLTWLVPWSADRPMPRGLLHAKVRGTGVCEAIFNSRGQRIGVLLFIGSTDDIIVLRPPLADPFSKPTRTLAELLRPGLEDPFDRVRVEGLVLSQQQATANLIHLRTDQGAMQVEVVEGVFEVGDRVAVVGYPVLANKHVVLREAVAQKLGHEPPPPPLVMDVNALMLAGSDSDLVRIRGVVLRSGLEAAKGSLFITSSDRVVEIVLSSAFDSAERSSLAQSLQVGALLELTGVAEFQGTMLTNGTVNFTDMRLTVRSPEDIVILKAPPWWTISKLLALAGGLAGILLASGAWVFSLRRRVIAQTAIIGEKISRETRWVERSRIARDIHDDVGSALTQITLLGDLGVRGGSDTQVVEAQFGRISHQAREAVRALDAIVWTVNPKNDSLAVTVSYLCQTVHDLTRDSAIRCRLEIPEDIPEMKLGAKVRHNLLLAAKEAVHNVLKHARANVLRLRMDCGLENLRLEISDDGCGLDPDASKVTRTGLDSMRQRMADVGGSLEISFVPGEGTSVAFVVPWVALE